MVKSGIAPIIEAMDKKQIAISTAADLAKLPNNAQQRLFQFHEEVITPNLKRTKYNSKETSLPFTTLDLNHFLSNCLHLYFRLMPYAERSKPL